MVKKVLLFLFACAVSLSSCIIAYATNFYDVPADAWYAKDLEEAVSKGLIKGVDDDNFAPDQNITYAQFITVLVREKYGEQSEVPGGKWYDGYVKKAVETGIIDPKKETIDWDKAITRGMTAVFMCKALGIVPDEKVEILFADCSNPTSSNSVMVYYQYLTKAYKEYLLDGTNFGTGYNYFKKNTDHWLPVTRAQLATMIIRVSKYRYASDTYKTERAKVRDVDLAARKVDYAKMIGLQFQSSSEHFDYYLNDTDIKAVSDLKKSLEDSYARIAADLKPSFNEKIRVLVYPDIITFHRAINMPDAPNWVVGTGGNNQLNIVSPLNTGGVHTYDEIMKIVVHEFTHVATWTITGKVGNIPKWLSEGIAYYEAKQFNDSQKNSMVTKSVPSLSQMEVADSVAFGEMGGYAFSYTIVEYLIKKYGMDKVVALIKNPADFQSIFGITKDEFEKQWLQYLRQSYK